MVTQQKITGLVHTAVLITGWTTSLIGWSKCGNLFGLFWRTWRSRCRVQLLSHWTRRTKRWVRNSPASLITRLVQNGSEQRSYQLPLPPFDHQLFYSASNNPFSLVSSCCLGALLFCIYAYLTWNLWRRRCSRERCHWVLCRWKSFYIKLRDYMQMKLMA